MGVSTEKPKRFKRRRGQLKVRGAKRHANGDWTVQAQASVNVELLDGRRIVADRDIHIRAHQIGKRRS